MKPYTKPWASIRIFSNDENSRIAHVQISGLTYMGEEITSFDRLTYEASPDNGADIHME